MFVKKYTRWVPILTLILCGVLLATVVMAGPYGVGKEGRKGEPDIQRGPMGPGMGQAGPGREMFMHFIGPGGAFADPEMTDIMAEIKILGFINRFNFSKDQLTKIAGLSKQARDVAGDAVAELRGFMVPRLKEHRDALMKGEKPAKGERPEPPEGMMEMGKGAKEALDKIVDSFFDLLTDEQRAMIKDMGAPGVGPMPGGMGGPGVPGQQGGQFGGQWRERQGYRMEAPGSENEVGEATGTVDEKGDRRAAQNPDKEKPFRRYEGGFKPGEGPGFNQPLIDAKMRSRMRVLELLLDKHTAGVIKERMNYM